MARSLLLPSSGSLIMIVGLIILASVGSVISLKCYYCDSAEACKKSPLDQKPCNGGGDLFCRTVTDKNKVVIDKSCAGKSNSTTGSCDMDPSGSGNEGCYCDKDLCNGNGGSGSGPVPKPAWFWTNLLWIGSICFYILAKGM